MAISDILGNRALWSFIKDQRLRGVLTRREFRFTQGYLQREFMEGMRSDRLPEISLLIHDGYGELSGRVKQRLIPLAVPFHLRFSLQRVEFTRRSRKIFLKVGETKSVVGDLLMGMLSERIPFISYDRGIIVCDLNRVPRLDWLFGYHVKGMPVMDYVTIRDLSLSPGEVVGRLGVSL